MSSPDVTITLGRSGRVVKREGGDSDSWRSKASRSASESYRRGDDRRGNGASNGFKVNEDMLLDHKDLRLELIKKRKLESNENHAVVASGNRWPEALEVESTFAGGSRSPINMDDRHQFDTWPRRNSLAMHYSRRDDPKLFPVLMRDSHPSLARDNSLVTSPLRTLGTSAGVSHPSYQPGLQEASTGTFIASPSLKIAEPSRLLHPIPMKALKTQPVAETARPVPTLPPSSGSTQRSPNLGGDQPLTVSGLLISLGLAKYAIIFQAEEVDMAALKQMGEMDLKDIGIPMGPRKKILQVLQVIFKRPPANRQL